MRKNMLLFNLAYYIFSLLIYTGILFISTNLFQTSSLGAAIAVTYGLLFLATPIIVAVLMRFSFLKWYVDPFAAAEVPLFLYVAMILKQMSRSGISFYNAFLKINGQLFADGGEGWIFLVGLFVFGLVASVSPARKRGENLSYRLISKFSV